MAEGFGLCLAESLACGVPVVATGWAAEREVVGDGPTYVTFDVDGLDPAYTPGLREVQADGQLLDWDSGVFEGVCRALVTDQRTLAASAH